MKVTSNSQIGLKVKTARVKGLDVKDPSLAKLAQVASEDDDYKILISHLEKGDPLAKIEEDRELRQLRGDYQHLGLQIAEHGPLMVRNGTTILLPKKERKRLLDEVL